MPRARRRAPRPGRLVTWRQILPAFCLTQIIGQGTGVQAAASLRDHALKSHLVDSDIEAGATTRRSKPCANASHGIIRPEAIARSNAIFGCAPAKLKCPRSVGLTPRPRAIFLKAASDAPPARITPFIGPRGRHGGCTATWKPRYNTSMALFAPVSDARFLSTRPC